MCYNEKKHSAAISARQGRSMNIPLYVAPTASAMTDFLRALPSGRKTLIFCEDRFTLEAERAVASARGAAFDVSVTTFARFLSDGTPRKVLSKQGSVLVVGGIAACVYYVFFYEKLEGKGTLHEHADADR